MSKPPKDKSPGSEQAATTPPLPKQPAKNRLLWVMVLLALLLGIAALLYSFTQSQQNNRAFHIQRDLLLQRINQNEREQRAALNSYGDKQAQLTEKVQKGIEAMQNQLARLPQQLTQTLLTQLIHQAQVLVDAQLPAQQVQALLQHARNMVRNDPAYESLRQALTADMAMLDSARSGQHYAALRAELALLRQQIRQLTFTPATLQQQQPPASQNESTHDSWWKSTLSAAGDLFSQLVVIRRHQGDVNLDMDHAQFANSILLIDAALSQAQIALLLGNAATFTSTIRQAIQLVGHLPPRYRIDQFRDRLNSLQQQGLPQPPTLQSVQQLERLTARDGY